MLDYHVHTALCNHACGSTAAYVAAAYAKGIREICFLDHLTLMPPEDANTMAVAEIPFYLSAVRNLATAWEGKVRVLAGLEVDYHPDAIPAICDILGMYDFDLVGFSVHFAGGFNLASRRGRKAYADRDPESICHLYIDKLESMVETAGFDVICHLDLMEKFAPSLSPSAADRIFVRMEKILDKVAATGAAVEVNTAGIDHLMARPYPSLPLLAACRKRQIPVTMGSDAHTPQEVGRHFAAGFSLLSAAGYHEITRFHRRTPIPTPLVAGERDLPCACDAFSS